VGAGTVEFLLSPSGEFYFLEMNTRLQVEHPVTECVVGIDLVREQLHIAEGGTLSFRGPPPLRGHAIEVRLYAEDPANRWLPSAGRLHRFSVPGVLHSFGPLPVTGLRLDSGVSDGSVVGVHYDPMLAKLIAWGESREEAARLLSAALAHARIHGVVTNRDLLVRVLRHPSFLAGDTDTGFLDAHPEVFAPLLAGADAARLSCLAAALAGSAARSASSSLPSGWRNVPSAPQTVAFEGPNGCVEVGYRLDRSGALAEWSVHTVDRDGVGLPGAGPDRSAPHDRPPVAIVSAVGDRVVLDVSGLRLSYSIHRVDDVSYVDGSEGSVTLTEVPRFPPPTLKMSEGSLVAPLPGTVGQVLVAAGQRVAAGDLLLTLEAMKLEHAVHAPAAGVVADVHVGPGSQVQTGTLLAVLAPD
jgi:propionyl-CoA carboxylase alpha chain